MATFKWTERLSVGDERIDSQHKQLFAIAGELVDAVAEGHGEETLKETFKRLKDYTEGHFNDEEDYMRELGFPDLELHAAEHALMFMRVRSLWNMIQEDKDISAAGVAGFLEDWIADHIMKKDVRVGAFARDKS